MNLIEIKIRMFLGDVQWNKNHVFNLCLTIGYFWTTLFVMIVLYIFIYGRRIFRLLFLLLLLLLKYCI